MVLFPAAKKDILARIIESNSNWFFNNENEDICDECSNDFDDYGDENDQKQTSTMVF